MRCLYVSQQGCYVSVKGENLLVKREGQVLGSVQLPLVEQVLIFGKSQMTTEAIRACLRKNIPIVYLSRMGYCYGRSISIERGYRYLSRYQQQLSASDRLIVARAIVGAKLKNSRVILLRQQRKRGTDNMARSIQSIEYLIEQSAKAQTIDRLIGFEGAAAHSYFSALGDCLINPDFTFLGRSRRPPGNPVNGILSFGYQILWNHLLALIELQGLDPYDACLHQSSERHAALASDLIEEFRAPIIDSLMLYLVNRSVISVLEDFDYRNGGCYLNSSGRKKMLRAFVQRMEEEVQSGEEEKQPRWDLLYQQVKCFKSFVYSPSNGYQPYLIR